VNHCSQLSFSGEKGTEGQHLIVFYGISCKIYVVALSVTLKCRLIVIRGVCSYLVRAGFWCFWRFLAVFGTANMYNSST
jgi:hypothetical protein